MNEKVLKSLKAATEVFWKNEGYMEYEAVKPGNAFTMQDIEAAEDRLLKFAPLIEKLFPETEGDAGIIESPVERPAGMQQYLDEVHGLELKGRLHIKRDDILPISGSVKARGGIYEILTFAEILAADHELIDAGEDYSQFAGGRFKEVFSRYTIVCASTGNLGLSIGIMSAKLGFKVNIHMSTDAKEWKKKMLREYGVNVIEHMDDYSHAVTVGREEAMRRDDFYFVDDEDSVTLFLGYAVSALRLKGQLVEAGIEVSAEHPLYVYLPCGVGGAPGGITFGLKEVFGGHVHPVFAEPTHSPCMMLGVMSGRHDEISVRDIGLDNVTIADGLAVGRASKFIGKTVENMIAGFYTVQDDELYRLLTKLWDEEKMKLEPSALAGMTGAYRLQEALPDFPAGTHLVWSTGGNMVPDEVWRKDYEAGQALLKDE
ncbi:D-serine ammonia-lyase [Lacicoccus alkaliphilus]|uniref:Probable D-serine dehydratase n=1 Tax=Lacicoccus alkaliphilus DSM 16010 TaxID=1123231 RepID=A0A1M7A5E9_9BACL|nr:D-serine ammonia-lyase [Salinicoccus alkaliphilus]SHL37947.1 D-serine ammonia-lyase [Salinicoccus alkaliphilus DSM 16010]